MALAGVPLLAADPVTVAIEVLRLAGRHPIWGQVCNRLPTIR